MIDLTKKALPNTVCVNGKAFSIYTDYRLWMRFEISVRKMKSGERIDIRYLFKNEYPSYCDISDLISFSRPQNILPRPIGTESNAIALDYEIDSDLIYSAFLGQYGIDLVDVEELHWHKFLALLRGLNDSTKLREVMGYRLYKKSTDKNIDTYAQLRDAWTIDYDEEIDEDLAEFSAMFERRKD